MAYIAPFAQEGGWRGTIAYPTVIHPIKYEPVSIPVKLLS